MKNFKYFFWIGLLYSLELQAQDSFQIENYEKILCNQSCEYQFQINMSTCVNDPNGPLVFSRDYYAQCLDLWREDYQMCYDLCALNYEN